MIKHLNETIFDKFTENQLFEEIKKLLEEPNSVKCIQRFSFIFKLNNII